MGILAVKVPADHSRYFDILANNGELTIYQPLVQLTEEKFDTTFALNARGTFFALQEAARWMADNGGIVSISTGGTVSPSPTASIDAGSKAAVEQFTKVLAKKIGKISITFNRLFPEFHGYINTAKQSTVETKGTENVFLM